MKSMDTSHKSPSFCWISKVNQNYNEQFLFMGKGEKNPNLIAFCSNCCPNTICRKKNNFLICQAQESRSWMMKQRILEKGEKQLNINVNKNLKRCNAYLKNFNSLILGAFKPLSHPNHKDLSLWRKKNPIEEAQKKVTNLRVPIGLRFQPFPLIQLSFTAHCNQFWIQSSNGNKFCSILYMKKQNHQYEMCVLQLTSSYH